ncbi:DUF3961 domain-containing protein [Bacillus cereus]|uniref:DUF3961 domain-containing protein n=1 Tax=Bacillus cereus TaxID=1396 RepID=A0AAW7NNN7_BACCE|nr:DUF3961 domain-containing protein [Bacillus cereus]MDN4875954.1 DUF3961 domain-containing protein [Bacillus cereus]MEB9377066.1 DUF3961 domain-containing protein [Bacillus cereus]
MEKFNDYFGLESKSDLVWFYGFYTVSAILIVINMIIVLI